MLIVVSYDIEADRTRARLAKKLRDFGPRVQKSVFEADVKVEELEKLHALLSETKLGSSDSIRLYQLCATCLGKTVIWGRGEVSLDKPYVVY